MEKDRRVVFGSYTHPDETKSAIEKLKNEGYSKEDITVYSKAQKERSFDKVDGNDDERDKERSFDKVDKDTEEKKDDDQSVMDKGKDFFTPDYYDSDDESENPNYLKENDILYPHRQDLADGNQVIVLKKPLEDENRIQI